MRQELAKGHLDLLLLSALADEAAHGYAIIETVRQKSGSTFDLPEGSVYPALHRLEREGLVKSRWSESVGRPRRVYSLTRKGTAHLQGQRREWTRFVGAVNAVAGARA